MYLRPVLRTVIPCRNYSTSSSETLRRNFRHIQIYDGPELYSQSVDKHLKICEAYRNHCRKEWDISLVNKERLILNLEKAESQGTLGQTLLVIPAGESTHVERCFQDIAHKIKRYVGEEGLSVFGTCGSGYALAALRTWTDKCEENPREAKPIVKESLLGLFNGLAAGPLSLCPTEVYNSNFFHEAVEVWTAETKCTVLLSGGGGLVPLQSASHKDIFLSHQNVKILAKYSEDFLRLKGKDFNIYSNAVVAFSYGKGKGIISMINPGYGPEDIDLGAYTEHMPGHDWEKIRNSLSSYNQRMRLSFGFFNELEKLD